MQPNVISQGTGKARCLAEVVKEQHRILKGISNGSPDIKYHIGLCGFQSLALLLGTLGQGRPLI